jgi:hypothetical protein
LGLFVALVRTAVNVATLPISTAKDVVTLGGTLTDERSALAENVERLKREADEGEEG